MRPSSSTSEPGDALPDAGALLTPLFSDPEVEALLDDGALLRAMLRFERELAAAQAELDVIPGHTAQAIADATLRLVPDPADVGRRSVGAGNPVNPLVQDLTAQLPDAARPFVHLGTTSQDVLDTALMLVARASCLVVVQRLETVGRVLVDLIGGHRNTVMAARTLGQQALPTTLGRVAAGWLTAVDDARDRLLGVADGRLAVQLGGAAGTLAHLDGRGAELVAALAARLDLAEPTVPWHTDRQRVLDLGAALAAAVATAGKIGLDLVVLAQTEIAELVPQTAGGSTAMPHKQNPVRAILARSAAVRSPGLLATLFAAAALQENERAAGGWHAEWQPLRELLSLCGGATGHLLEALQGLRVDPERMRADLELTGGLLFSESVAAALTPVLGRPAAHELVGRCARTAAETGRPFAAVLADEPRVGEVLDQAAIRAALDPTTATAVADALVERALAAHHGRRSGEGPAT